MHQTRQETSTVWPIQRKGTKYIARALNHVNDSLPVVVAVRDVLKLAKTAKEVEEMIKDKTLKINGRIVEDVRESIQLFHILEAGKKYQLTLLPTKKFSFEEIKGNERLCKIVSRRLVKDGKMQYNLHDGSNFIAKKDFANINDSAYLDLTGKVKSVVALEKGKEALVISGKNMGVSGKIEKVEGKVVHMKIKGREDLAELQADRVVAQ